MNLRPPPTINISHFWRNKHAQDNTPRLPETIILIPATVAKLRELREISQ